jgi:hypothetical protein
MVEKPYLYLNPSNKKNLKIVFQVSNFKEIVTKGWGGRQLALDDLQLFTSCLNLSEHEINAGTIYHECCRPN